MRLPARKWRVFPLFDLASYLDEQGELGWIRAMGADELLPARDHAQTSKLLALARQDAGQDVILVELVSQGANGVPHIAAHIIAVMSLPRNTSP